MHPAPRSRNEHFQHSRSPVPPHFGLLTPRVTVDTIESTLLVLYIQGIQQPRIFVSGFFSLTLLDFHLLLKEDYSYLDVCPKLSNQCGFFPESTCDLRTKRAAQICSWNQMLFLCCLLLGDPRWQEAVRNGTG